MAPSGAPDTGPEQPDTAAIREWYVGRRRPSSPTMIAALCDALDAARAELLHGCPRPEVAAHRAVLARAEAAEARIEEMKKAILTLDAERLVAEAESEALRREQIHAVRLAEAAEARIAAALAACSDWETGDHWSPEALLRAVRRALTEGTDL